MNEVGGGADMFGLDEGHESSAPSEVKEVDTSAAQTQRGKAKKVRKQIQQTQDKNAILSKFLTKVLGKFGVRSKVINAIFHILEENEENGLELIYCLFYPYIDAPELKETIKEKLSIDVQLMGNLDKPSIYPEYLKLNKEIISKVEFSKMGEVALENILTGIVDILESIRLGGKDFWEALKSQTDSSYDEFVLGLKIDIKKALI